MNPVLLSADIIKGFQAAFLWSGFDKPAAVPEFHSELWGVVCENQSRTAIACPRDHAKSTAITYTYSLASVCFRTSRNILIVSDTERQAAQHLRNIRRALNENEALKRAFGIKPPIIDAETEYAFEFEDGVWAHFSARGAEQSLRGVNYGVARPDLIIVDDLENDVGVVSPTQRQRLKNWAFSTLFPALSVDGRIVVCGTILHHDSLLNNFLESKFWRSKIYAAHNADFSRVLWPERHPAEKWKKLIEYYSEEGKLDSYYREFLSNPVVDKDLLLDPAKLKPLPAEVPQVSFVGCVDAAGSSESYSDYTALAMIGIDGGGRAYIVDMVRKRLKPEEIVDAIFTLQRTYNPTEWLFESGTLKNMLLSQIEMRAREPDGVYIPISQTKLTPTKDKISRAQPFSGFLRAGKVFADTEAEWFPEFAAELKAFPAGKYDDQVDAAGLFFWKMDLLNSVGGVDDTCESSYYSDYDEEDRAEEEIRRDRLQYIRKNHRAYT